MREGAATEGSLGRAFQIEGSAGVKARGGRGLGVSAEPEGPVAGWSEQSRQKPGMKLERTGPGSLRALGFYSQYNGRPRVDSGEAGQICVRACFLLPAQGRGHSQGGSGYGMKKAMSLYPRG